MMSRLTQTQGKRLCELAHLFRPSWDIPGIEAAVKSVAERAAGVDVARALLAICGDPNVKTPGMLSQPGRHWPIDDQGTSALPPSHDVPCPTHPGEVHPCPQCRKDVVPCPPDLMDELRAKVRAAKEASRTVNP